MSSSGQGGFVSRLCASYRDGYLLVREYPRRTEVVYRRFANGKDRLSTLATFYAIFLDQGSRHAMRYASELLREESRNQGQHS
jgi:hypothetical protein